MSRYFTLSAFLLIILISEANGQVLESSPLPIVVISTNGATIRDNPKIVVDMGIIDNGTGARNYLTDPFNAYNGKAAIEYRGSSSQMFPKKQYGVELRDASGTVDIDTSLLGMPSESDWILFAPYNDKTLMRDVLAYKLGRDLGRYAPRTRYCELVLNGSYQGIYVLIEKIKRDKARVDIAKLDPDEVTGDDLTGGYIVKIDKPTGDVDPGWYSAYPPPGGNINNLVHFLPEYPDPEDLSTAQREYIKKFIADFEATLIGSDFNNPVDGYAKFIDVNSFVDFFIMNEISKNVDGYRLSTYMHKQKDSDGGKLVMGPIWDFNLGFGNADYCTSGGFQGLVLDFNKICPNDKWLIPFWWERLFKDSNFTKRVLQRWTELRADKFSTERVVSYIDSVSLALAEPGVRNFQRWPVLGQYVWPNYYVGSTYNEEVDWLKGWVDQRMEWLDQHLNGIVTSSEPPQSGKNFRISAYPNPADEQFSFDFEFVQPGAAGIEIFDLMGRKVESLNTGYKNPGKLRVDAGSSLANGQYHYVVTFEGHVIGTGRLIKK